MKNPPGFSHTSVLILATKQISILLLHEATASKENSFFSTSADRTQNSSPDVHFNLQIKLAET